MDTTEITCVGPSAVSGEGERRFHWARGGQRIEVVVPETAVTVWFQVRPGAGEQDLEEWARDRGQAIVAERFEAFPQDLSDVVLDRGTGAPDTRREADGQADEAGARTPGMGD
jgi:hypothetical protein